MDSNSGVSRRTVVKGLAAGCVVSGVGRWPRPASASDLQRQPTRELTGTDFELRIGETRANFTGNDRGNWTGLLRPGERVRLRLINGSAQTYFDHPCMTLG